MRVIEVTDSIGYEAFKLSADPGFILSSGGRATLDIETTISPAPTGTSKMWSDLYDVGEGESLISLACTFDGDTVFFFDGRDYDGPRNYLRQAKRIIESVDWTMHNGAFDCSALKSILDWNLHLAHDTMGMQYLLDPDKPKGLGVLSAEYLGVEGYKDVNYENILEEPWEKIVAMNAQDVVSTWKLYRILADQLNADPGLSRVYQWILMPAARVLPKITRRGVPMNRAALFTLTRTLLEEKESHLEALQRSTPPPWEEAYPNGWPKKRKSDPEAFNPGSPKQVAHVLFDIFDLDPIEWTDSGNPSTAADVLNQLVNSGSENSRAWLEHLLAYRKSVKSLGYVESWASLVGKDGRLHPRYKPMHVVTGRLSSEYPNIQQVPRGTEFRSVFGSDNLTWMKADYSQIELRLAAWTAQEELMLEAYRRGDDVHRQTAMLILGDDGDDARQVGKTLNFGLLYGAGPATLQRIARSDYGVNLSLSEAERYREEFFRAYPGLLLWHRRMEEEISRSGESRSALGRVRYLPDAKVPWDVQAMRSKKGAAIREGINHPIQSFASDIMLRAVAELSHAGLPLIATVHDEVDLLVPEFQVADTARLVKETMEDLTWLSKFGIKLTVPVVADVETGPSWGELKEMT
jgi:DNA polymerase-1